MLSMRPTKTETQKDLIMIASPIYPHKSGKEKMAPTFLKYVSQRSLAVVMFVALAVVASVGNKPSHKTALDLTNSFSIRQSRDQESFLSPNPWQLFGNTLRSIRNAFNDPALIECAKDQGVDTADSPMASDSPASSMQSAKDFGNKSALNQ